VCCGPLWQYLDVDSEAPESRYRLSERAMSKSESKLATAVETSLDTTNKLVGMPVEIQLGIIPSVSSAFTPPRPLLLPSLYLVP
jgi:hypothetical protein